LYYHAIDGHTVIDSCHTSKCRLINRNKLTKLDSHIYCILYVKCKIFLNLTFDTQFFKLKII